MIALQAKARAEFHRLQVVTAGADRSELTGWDRYWKSVGLIIANSLHRLDGCERAADWLKDTAVRAAKQQKLSLREVTSDELRKMLHAYASPSRAKKPKLGPAALELGELLRAHSTLSTVSVTSRDGMIQLGSFRADQCGDLARVLAQVGR